MAPERITKTRCKHPTRTLGHCEPSCRDICYWSQHMLISAHRGVPTTPKARVIPADHRPPGLSVRKNVSNVTLPVEMEAVCLRVCVSCAGSRLGDLAAEWCAVCLCACVFVRVCCALCVQISRLKRCLTWSYCALQRAVPHASVSNLNQLSHSVVVTSSILLNPSLWAR